MSALSLDDTDNSQITLVAQDGTKISVNKQVCKLSSLIQVLIDNDAQLEEVKLDQVENGEVLQVIVEYLNARNGEPGEPIIKPLPSSKPFVECVSAAQGEFIEKLYNKYLCSEVVSEKHKYYKIVSGANYLHIECLLHLLSARLAYIFKTKTKEEIIDFLK